MAEVEGDAGVGITRDVAAVGGDDAGQMLIVNVQLFSDVCDDIGGGHGRSCFRGRSRTCRVGGHVALCGRRQARGVRQRSECVWGDDHVGVVEARVCMLQMVPWLKSGVPGEVVTVDVSLVEMFRRLRRNADGADRGTLAGRHA